MIMRNYELVIVLDGKVTSARKKSVTEKIEKLVKTIKGPSAQAGKVGKVKDWGVKNLEYRIGKSDSGLFLIFQLELDSKSVNGLSAKIKSEEDIIRYLLVRK